MELGVKADYKKRQAQTRSAHGFCAQQHGPSQASECTEWHCRRRKAAAAAGSWIRDVNIEAEEIQFIKMAWGRLELRSSGTAEEH